MGKGFNNYMCKKFFHPSSADNLKRVWVATKKAEVEKKQQDELRIQYDREQELYNNKALLSKETKEKLELNFMYEPPPGLKKIGEKDEEEEEYKFEWQRTWGHAPKESYLKEGDEFNEQPFGIQVCQAKCIKCGKHGHMNTDRRCHLYGKAVDHEAPVQNLDQSKLLDEMKADGLAMRWSAWDMNKGAGPNHAMVEEDRRPVDKAEVLKSMSKEEKKALLKKLKKMEKKKKKKAKKEKKKKRSSGSSSDSSEESENEEREVRNGGRRDEKWESRYKDGREEERHGERSKVRRDRSNSRNRNRRDRSGSRNRRDRSGSRDRRSYRDGEKHKNERRDRSSDRNGDRDRSKRDRSNDRSIEKSKRRDRSSDRDTGRDKSRRDRSRSRGRSSERDVGRDKSKRDRSRSRDARRSRKEEGYSNPWV